MPRNKNKYKHFTSETSRMDSFKSAEEAAYLEKSEAGASESICSWQIPISFDDLRILNNNKDMLFQVLQIKFDCQSTLDSPPQEDNSSDSLQVYRKMLMPGLELSVWKGDLTRHVVDAVVNAANEYLSHEGGLAYALVKAGGNEIQLESREYISKYGKLPTGKIAVTSAWRLPCKYIIHAVGPRWQERNREECVLLLQKAITSILNHATTSAEIETVAIPALSSGIFSFPLPLCTNTILKTIRYYFQGKQVTGNLKEIHLVSNEDATVDAFKNASKFILEGIQVGSWIPQEAKTPFYSMVVNNVTLQIVQDYIELQETDVIVNSLHLFSNSYYGPVSRSILQKAGKEIEDELFYKMNIASINKEVVFVTKGYNLTSQYVYHVLWNDSHPSQVLPDAMKMCFKGCISQNITSISFPALGVGHNLSMDQAAKIMFDEVLAFADFNLKENFTVNFVIFPTEKEVYKAFIREMEKHKSLSQNHSDKDVLSVPQRMGAERKSGPSDPAISLKGTNQEKIAEAEAWILRTLNLQERHIIENNHIFYLGKKEHDILSGLQTPGMSISENISAGKAYLEIKGTRADLIKMVMHIELMLCEVQEERARKKENAIWNLAGLWTSQPPKSQHGMKENTFRKCLSLETAEIQEQKKLFEKYGLRVIKVERIDNMGLTTAFYHTKKMMMEKKTKGITINQRLFQQVPYQFCDVVCRAGFQRLYSMPCDPTLGAGIYFTQKPKHLVHEAKKTSSTDKFIYMFEAEVLTGFFNRGHQSQIVPPPLSSGDIESYDSVVDDMNSPETYVIFNSMQALPRYLWTCMQDHVQPQGTVFSPQNQWSQFAGGSHVYLTQQRSFSPQQAWGKLPSGSSVD